jgi:hypothetical protein
VWGVATAGGFWLWFMVVMVMVMVSALMSVLVHEMCASCIVYLCK